MHPWCLWAQRPNQRGWATGPTFEGGPPPLPRSFMHPPAGKRHSLPLAHLLCPQALPGHPRQCVQPEPLPQPRLEGCTAAQHNRAAWLRSARLQPCSHALWQQQHVALLRHSFRVLGKGGCCGALQRRDWSCACAPARLASHPCCRSAQRRVAAGCVQPAAHHAAGLLADGAQARALPAQLQRARQVGQAVQLGPAGGGAVP